MFELILIMGFAVFATPFVVSFSISATTAWIDFTKRTIKQVKDLICSDS